jgi:NhaP-type Na+/H+ or K+/H+ antiporter
MVSLHGCPTVGSPWSKAQMPWKGVFLAFAASLLLNVLLVLHCLNLHNVGFNGLDLYDAEATLFANSELVDVQQGYDFAVETDHSYSFSAGQARQLGAGPAATGVPSASSGHSSSSHQVHKQDALLYMFNALIVGAVVIQISARFPFLQQTVLLFVIGFIYSVVVKAFKLTDKMGVFGASYDMWMTIDPHLMMFALLPALLAGDAMSIDTAVAKKVGYQCLWLAGPGVLVGSFGCATFLYYYLDWDFYFCLCSGAILCATDPVAVVGLLKELGASPVLTIQIQGESLLNDGTAIVVYLLSYNILKGEKYEWTDVAEFLVKKALMAWALGLFIGFFFFSWIRLAANKLDHSSSMIQIVLTFCCAYWSFIFVEGVLHLSGVLATVASSLVLAHYMWPYVVHKDSMIHVWHTFESLGNIIIFFLAGSKTGQAVFDIELKDYVHLLVIYVVLTVIRGCLIFGSIPILGFLSVDRKPISWQEALVMTWGGLRGAVGLALAITVKVDLAPDICRKGYRNIKTQDGERLLFYVSGIAFLTLVVNASTAPYLVSWLGITAQPQARKTLLKMFHSQLLNWSTNNQYPSEVTAALQEMLDEAAHEIDHSQESATGPKSIRVGSAKVKPMDGELDMEHHKSSLEEHQTNRDVIKEFTEERARLTGLLKEMYPKEDYNAAKHLLMDEESAVLECQDNIDDMIKLIADQGVDIGLAKVVNQCFLALVFNNYVRLIESDDLRPGSHEAHLLFASVRFALSPLRADLADGCYMQRELAHDDEFATEEDDDNANPLSDASAAFAPKGSPLAGLLTSAHFNIAIALIILLNSIQVIAEEAYRYTCKEKCGIICPTKAIDTHVVWLVLDCIFTACFTIEFVLKFAWLKCAYFKDLWNRFDFFLVGIGLFGLIASAAGRSSTGDVTGKTRIIRVARVLRTLRFLRIFRLFHARLSADKFVSPKLATYMKKIVTLLSFAKSHERAQRQLVKFFGGNGILDDYDEAELARCILQSKQSVNKALYAAALAKQQVGEQVNYELDTLRKRKKITESFTHFVEEAFEHGALSATETHDILHPLNHQIAMCMRTLNERAEGVLDRKMSASFCLTGSLKEAGTDSVPPPIPPMVEEPLSPTAAPPGFESEAHQESLSAEGEEAKKTLSRSAEEEKEEEAKKTLLQEFPHSTETLPACPGTWVQRLAALRKIPMQQALESEAKQAESIERVPKTLPPLTSPPLSLESPGAVVDKGATSNG